nr:MAG TPA: Pandonodin peptide [Caudoviricetes sp.]
MDQVNHIDLETLEVTITVLPHSLKCIPTLL